MCVFFKFLVEEFVCMFIGGIFFFKCNVKGYMGGVYKI